MKTPREKYMNDPEYHQLVCMLESFIEQVQFTPSELREAVVLACINYERRYLRETAIDPRAAEAFRVLDEFTTRSRDSDAERKGEQMTKAQLRRKLNNIDFSCLLF